MTYLHWQQKHYLPIDSTCLNKTPLRIKASFPQRMKDLFSNLYFFFSPLCSKLLGFGHGVWKWNFKPGRCSPPGKRLQKSTLKQFRKSEQQVKLAITRVYLGNWAWHSGVSDKVVCVFCSIKYRYNTQSCHWPSETVCFSLGFGNQ